MTPRYKFMCGCKCCISANSMQSSLLTWNTCHTKHLKNRGQNSQNRRSDKLSSHIFQTYKNAVRPHGCHIYNYAADMDMAKMCPCL